MHSYSSRQVSRSGTAARRIEGARAWRLSGLSAALFLPFGLYLPYFPVWLTARGFSASEIAATLATPLILRVLLMPIIAYIADRRGIAATLAFCACFMAVGFFSLGFAHGFALVFLGSVLAISAQGSMPALADALSLAEIRRFEKIGLRRIQFGRIRVGASLSVLSMMLLSGLIVGAFPGERIIYALTLLSIFPAIAAVATALTMRRLRFDHSARGGLTEDRHALPLAILVMVAAALVQASHAEIYAFGTLQWKSNGFTSGAIGIAWAIGVMSESVLFIFGGRYIRGIRQALSLLTLGAAGAVVRWVAMSLNPGATIVFLLQVMHSLSFAATYMGAVLALGALAGRNHRARMQGWASAAMALSMALATMASGQLTYLYGAHAYLAMAALAAAGLGLLLVAAALHRRLPVEG